MPQNTPAFGNPQIFDHHGSLGKARPLSVKVDTFGTGDAAVSAEFVKTMDFRPAAIIERFQMLRPIYRQTTNYGHFGKPGLPWEE